MSLRQTILNQGELFLLVHKGSGVPYALRVDLKKAYRILLMLLVGAFFLFLGTLLYFKQLETNRKLEQRLIELEIQGRLLRNPPQIQSARVSSQQAFQESQTIIPAVSQAIVTPKPEPVTPPSLGAKIGDFHTKCEMRTCTASVSLIPKANGYAQGKVLLVLETEFIRIGEVTHVPDQKKRYFIFPGYKSVDDLNLEELPDMKGRSYKFSKLLQTQATFHIGEELNPVAMNVFVFDSTNKLVDQNRKEFSTQP